MRERVVVIGLDGADWRIVRPLIADGVMPNLQHLIENGVSGPLESTIPTHSNTAWVSFMTGVNPGAHGVFSFLERATDDPMRLIGVNSRSNQRESIFHILSRQEYVVGSVNVPVTYPPFAVNGFLLSGMFVPEGAQYTHPISLAGEIDDAVGGFPLNKIRWRFMPHQYRDLLEEAIQVNQQRARVLEYLMDHMRWDVYAQVFVSPDRIQHALMHMIDPCHPHYREEEARQYRDLIRAFYGSLDDMLGRVIERTDRDGLSLIVLSDHGFQPCDRELYVPEILAQHGLMARSQRRVLNRRVRRVIRQALGAAASRQRPSRGPQVGLDVDWSRSRAYVTTATDQGVSVNVAGREPYGVVNPYGEYDDVREEIRKVLLGLRDPETGNALVDAVWFREEIYHGSCLDKAPDVIFVPAEGLTTVSEQHRNLAPAEVRTGEHALHGIIVGYGSSFKHGTILNNAKLIDLAPTILYLAGASIPEDLDGTVLVDALNPGLVKSNDIMYERVGAGAGARREYSDLEESQVAEQLRGLGYI